ncbi:hypothetical protein QYF36_014335 [Acer negundo]|nr:hypothetical protein QYF36_014335 [Acer negundo]
MGRQNPFIVGCITGASSSQHLGLFNLTNDDDNKFKQLKLKNGATGQLVESHKILSWSFSNSNFSIGDALVTTNLPSFVLPKESVFRSKGFIIGASVGAVLIVVCGVVICAVLVRKKRKKGEGKEEIEDWELQYWPHRIGYQEVYTATKGFSEENVVGCGANDANVRPAMRQVLKVLEGNGIEEERLNVNLLRRLETTALRTQLNLSGSRGHPTFNEIYMNLSNSASLTTSDVILEGSCFIFFSVPMSSQTLILLLVVILSNLNSISCLEFVFNTNFNSTNIHTYGNATIENSIVSLTNQTVFTIGRALYPSKITTKQHNSTNPLPFSTSFIFSISPYRNLLPGHGFAFVFFPFTGITGATSEQYLGLFNSTNEDDNKFKQLKLKNDANVRPAMRQVLKGLEEERLDVNLLERIETSLRNQLNLSGSRQHPTFNLSNYASLATSDIILEGR